MSRTAFTRRTGIKRGDTGAIRATGRREIQGTTRIGLFLQGQMESM